jgi:hypothetical protein
MKCSSSLTRRMTGWMKCPSGWMTGRVEGKLLSSTSSLYLATIRPDEGEASFLKWQDVN